MAKTLTIELRGCDTATCCGVELVDDRGPITRLARKLIEDGHNPNADVVVLRGTTVCFDVVSLSRWAAITTPEHDEKGLYVRKYAKFERPEAWGG